MEGSTRRAAEKLYKEYKDYVYNFLLQLSQDSQLAQDVTQHTFLKLLNDATVTELKHPKAYIFTVARNVLRDHWKKKREIPLFDDHMESSLEDESVSAKPESPTDEEDLANKIQISIQRMPTKQRELMLLRYRDDLSYQEISEVTGRNISDIKVGLHRARQKFEKSFTHEMYARIAGERKRCDKIEEILATVKTNTFTDDDLERASTHIERCDLCREDQVMLKRRRKLFSLFPFVAAPLVLDDLMQKAYAESNTHAGAAEQTATQSIFSSVFFKAAAMIVVGLSVALFLTSFQQDALSTLQLSVSNSTGASVENVQWKIEQDNKILTVLNTANLSQSLSAGTYVISATVGAQTIMKDLTLNEGETISETWLLESKLKEPTRDTKITQQPEDSANESSRAIANASVQPAKDLENAKISSEEIQKNEFRYRGPPLVATQVQTFEDGDQSHNQLAITPFGIRTQMGLGSDNEFITDYDSAQCSFINNVKKVYFSSRLDEQGRCEPFTENTDTMLVENYRKSGLSEEEIADMLGKDGADDEGIFSNAPCHNANNKHLLGETVIANYKTEHWKCIYGRGTRDVNHWYAPELGIVIKDSINGATTELQNIELKNSPKSHFRIPDTYRAISKQQFILLLI